MISHESLVLEIPEKPSTNTPGIMPRNWFRFRRSERHEMFAFLCYPQEKAEILRNNGDSRNGVLTPYIVVILPRKPNEAFTI